jgi:hypothetical protein
MGVVFGGISDTNLENFANFFFSKKCREILLKGGLDERKDKNYFPPGIANSGLMGVVFGGISDTNRVDVGVKKFPRNFPQ